MKVLVFDTETTNLLPKYVPPTRNNLAKFPHVVQMSFMLYDVDMDVVLESRDYVIDIPIDVDLSEESTNIHGIDRARMAKDGVSIKTALDEFSRCYALTDHLVAHNFAFDNTMIIVEALRNGMRAIVNTVDPNRKCFCSMQKSIAMCNIIATNERGSYMKFPKQIELHKYLFGDVVDEDKLHNSFVDILLCLRCYMKMVHDRDVVDTCEYLSDRFDEIARYTEIRI